MRRYLFIILPFILLFTFCDDENPVQFTGEKPGLSNLVAPTSLYLNSNIPKIISIKTTDPQGIDDIESVEVDIYFEDVVRRDVLYDDGKDGDIIPFDGVFTKSYTADFANGQTGDYTFIFKAIDFDGNQSETLSHIIAVIDGDENTSPVIETFDVPAEIDVKQNTDYLITATINDPQGLDDILTVNLDLYSSTSTLANFSETLRNDGEEGDEIANDAVYSYSLNSKFSRDVVGKFTARIQVIDAAQNKSRPVTKIIDVIKSDNDPPVLFNLVAPDTMRLLTNKSATATLMVSVSDPQGLDDIREVYFNSYKPDGNPSTGNPFKLLDDGNTSQSGDETANDGIYSITIVLPSTTPTGDYLFIFEAVDNQDFKSETKEHTITVANL